MNRKMGILDIVLGLFGFQKAGTCHLRQARQFAQYQDYFGARVEYMKAVQSFKNTGDESGVVRADEEYEAFAQTDPIRKAIIDGLMPRIKETRGILESDITQDAANLEWNDLYREDRDVAKDDIRYALYFAERFGEIVRVKRGRSFQLFLPDDPLIEDAKRGKLPVVKRPDMEYFEKLCERQRTRAKDMFHEGEYRAHLKAKLSADWYRARSVAINAWDPTIIPEILNGQELSAAPRTHVKRALTELGMLDRLGEINATWLEIMQRWAPFLNETYRMVAQRHRELKELRNNDRRAYWDWAATVNSNNMRQVVFMEIPDWHERYERLRDKKDLNRLNRILK